MKHTAICTLFHHIFCCDQHTHCRKLESVCLDSSFLHYPKPLQLAPGMDWPWNPCDLLAEWYLLHSGWVTEEGHGNHREWNLFGFRCRMMWRIRIWLLWLKPISTVDKMFITCLFIYSIHVIYIVTFIVLFWTVRNVVVYLRHTYTSYTLYIIDSSFVWDINISHISCIFTYIHHL